MDAIPGTPEYQPKWYEKIWAAIAKRAPYYIGRFIQMIMYSIFKVFQFIVQMFHDAIGR